eukprot:g832.t1
MLRTMVTQLIEHERIKTTFQKAKEVSRMADKMVTYAKKDREGGYTRVLRVGSRYGDAADMALLEFVDRPGELRKANAKWKATELVSDSIDELMGKDEGKPASS